MSQKLPVYKSKWTRSTNSTEYLIIYYNDIGTFGYTLDVDIKHPEQFRMV